VTAEVQKLWTKVQNFFSGIPIFSEFVQSSIFDSKISVLEASTFTVFEG
jgi:hypothetical protein